MARGFDEYFGHTSGHWGEYFDAPLEDNGRMIRTKGYIVDVCTEFRPLHLGAIYLDKGLGRMALSFHFRRVVDL